MFFFYVQSAIIVTTFSILEDFTQQVIKGSKHFKVHSIVKKTDDPHTFVVTPKDYITLSKADILIENGLGFESWLPNMVKSVNFKGVRVIATRGIVPMRFVTNAKIYDPHAWHNISYAKIYVKNIARALIAADPKNAKIYENNRDQYLAKLDKLHIKAKAKFMNLKNTKILTTHDAFWYFGKSYNVSFISPLGISTEEEPSSFEIAKLVKYIRQNKITGAFFEAHTNNNLIKKISEETKIHVGGTLYADSLKEGGYIDTVEHNIDSIKKVLNKFTA
jgi:zinc/manganese transport system substrate-binding protein